jgi:hypothetical protein
MAKRVKFDKNAAFKNIIGQAEEEVETTQLVPEIETKPEPEKETKTELISSEEVSIPQAGIDLTSETSFAVPDGRKARGESRGKAKTNRDEICSVTVHLLKSQHRALKLRTALSDDPADKDMSTIIRIAIDQYLANAPKLTN